MYKNIEDAFNVMDTKAFAQHCINDSRYIFVF